VGLYANAGVRDSHRWVSVQAARRGDQQVRILESLAQLNYLTLIPFDRLLREEASRFPYGATLVLITPIMSAVIHSAILDLRAAGHPIALVMIGQPIESAAPDVPTYFVTQNWTEMERLVF